MAERDYNLGPEKFPQRIELCGTCGRRLHRMPPDQSRPYCEKCGHGAERPPGRVRAPGDVMKALHTAFLGRRHATAPSGVPAA